ncbi:Isochorismatase-like domain and EF-hand domain and EF-hand domain pair-containing protein [Aphelenchoides besseyi]|nr:Isochorismatase-like domain and EF-hand domain and EF-hand domain pair-containing protein [Aphelenchoides besseyi]
MSPPAISKLTSDSDFETFSAFIRSLVVDESPSNEDMLRIFNVFDQDKDGVLNKQETEQVNKKIVRTINHMRSSLIVVDFQNDFVDGSLAIKASSIMNKGRAQQDPQEAIPLLNHLLSRHRDFDSVVYTMDWHPSNHISFYEHCRNQDRIMQKTDKSRKLKPFDVVTFEEPNCRQVLYPSHCVENSWGADLNASVRRVDGAKYVRKGTDIYVDAYSGFADNNGKIKSDLENILRDDRINTLFICGLALDICVASTARDASKLKFFTCVIRDCCKGLSEEQIKRTCSELRSRNVPYVETHEVDQFLENRKIPWLWICQMVGLAKRQRRKNRKNGTTVDVELATESPGTPHGTKQSLLPGVCHEVISMDAS